MRYSATAVSSGCNRLIEKVQVCSESGLRYVRYTLLRICHIHPAVQRDLVAPFPCTGIMPQLDTPRVQFMSRLIGGMLPSKAPVNRVAESERRKGKWKGRDC